MGNGDGTTEEEKDSSGGKAFVVSSKTLIVISQERLAELLNTLLTLE